MGARALTAQAVILAGGQGTRLRPLTLSRAKPVVPLLNRPFLAYQIALLRRHGVRDVILSCSYRIDDVRAALGDARDLGVTLRYVIEDEPLGTGGGVRNAADLTRGTIFVLNGDVLTDADLTAMRLFHEERGSRVTIFLTPVDDPRAYGLVETDAHGQLVRFREKPGPEETISTNMINAGIYLIDAALLERIPSGRPVSIEREFFPAAIADGIASFGWSAPAYWRDIGNPSAYRAAQVDLLDGRVKTTLSPAGQLHQGSWVVSPAAMTEGGQRCARGEGGTHRAPRGPRAWLDHRGGGPRARRGSVGARARRRRGRRAGLRSGRRCPHRRPGQAWRGCRPRIRCCHRGRCAMLGRGHARRTTASPMLD